MKILCVSDQIDPLVYSTKAKERFSDIDAILCAGDLPSEYIDFIVSTLNKPTYFIFGNHNLSEFGLYHKIKHRGGAHPTMNGMNSYDLSGSHGADYIGFKSARDKRLMIKTKGGKMRPLLIAGASGSMRYNGALNQYTDFQMMMKLISLIPAMLTNKLLYGKALDIFLTHASPRHVHDREDPCHKGFECFNWFIRTFAPTFLVHGHIHLYDMNEQRVTKIETKNGTTMVVNAYSYTLIELTGD